MTRCPLCNRAYHAGILAPVWWHHYEVCRRARCRAAAEDALVAVERARERYDDLASQIEQRAETSHTPVPVGWRSDAMVRMDHDDEDWGALAAAKHHHRGETDA